MDFKEQERALLNGLSASLDDEELALSVFQGLIAAEISSKRIKLGLSQKEFADSLGVSQGLVSRWENGDTNFTLSTLVKIALNLKIEMRSPFVPAIPKTHISPRNNIVVFPNAAPNSYTIYSESVSEKYSSETDQELKEM